MGSAGRDPSHPGDEDDRDRCHALRADDSHDTVGVTWAQVLLNYAPMNEFGLEVRLAFRSTPASIVANENDGRARCQCR